MNSVTTTQPRPSRRATLLGVVLTLFAISLPLSIAAAQILLTLSALLWLPDRAKWGWTPASVAAAAYSLWTLVSAATSADPWSSILDAKELLLFAILVVVPSAIDQRPKLAQHLVDALIFSAVASALFGLVLYITTPGGLENRSRGPFGHYMAFAGVLMLVATAAWATLITGGKRHRLWALATTPLLVVGLGVTYARNAWLGFAAAALAITVAKQRRALPFLVIGTIVIVTLAPPAMRDRLASSFKPTANQDRLEMLDVGWRIVCAHPLFGVGANQIPEVYQQFGGSRVQPHLHNNVLQIAAERGIPALVYWLALIVALAVDAVRAARTDHRDAIAAASFGAIVALVVAGMFEYNFGDSEVRMTFLLLTSLSRPAKNNLANRAHP